MLAVVFSGVPDDDDDDDGDGDEDDEDDVNYDDDGCDGDSDADSDDDYDDEHDKADVYLLERKPVHWKGKLANPVVPPKRTRPIQKRTYSYLLQDKSADLFCNYFF